MYIKSIPPEIHLPPQEVAAEEEILGGILLDPYALGRVIDVLKPEAFYIDAHRWLYQEILNMKRQLQPIDLQTVTVWLNNHKLLERIGGQCKLAQLINRTVSAINIDNMAKLVMDKFARRQVLHMAKEAEQLAYEQSTPLPEILKLLENKVLEVTAFRNNGESYRHTQSEIDLQLLTKEIEEIEQIDSPFMRKLETKKLMKKWDIRTEKEFLDLHAKWLEGVNIKRSYSLDEYLELHGQKSVGWYLDGWIPEKSITVIHSLGGVGKTTLINTLARSLITGTPWSGYEVSQPRKVLWVQTDQGPTVTNLLLDRQGFFSLAPNEKARQRILDDWYIEEYALLEKELTEHQYDLVIIDSLASVSAQLIYKENDQEFARPFSRLRHIANKHNCAFLILHHSGKSGDMRGTTAIYNAADQVWKLDRVTHAIDTIGNLTIEKSRFREDKKTYRVQFDADDHSWFTLGQVTGSGETEEIQDTINPTLKGIQKLLRSHEGVGFECPEIAERLNINPDYCRKLLGQGIREGLVSSFRGTRKFPVYYLGQLKTDPCDPTDPHPRIGLEDRSQPQKGQGLHILRPPTDPCDPQNSINVQTQSSGSEDRRIARIGGSVEFQPRNEPKTPSQHTDNQVREAWNKPKTPYQHPESPFRVGQRVIMFGEEYIVEIPGNPQSQLAGLPKATPNWQIDLPAGNEVGQNHDAIVGKESMPTSEPKTPAPDEAPIDLPAAEIQPRLGCPFKEGDRLRNKSKHPITVIANKGSYLEIRYDSGVEATLGTGDVEALPPSEDPKVRAIELFNTLKIGQQLKAMKYHDHKGFARRAGKITKLVQKDDKFWALVETDTSLHNFNLEAVEVLE